MLFFAVFLGFVAENMRESNVEHRHEKEYAAELYKELYADSIAFTQKLTARLSKEQDCDYMYSYLKDSSLTDLPKKFYPAYTIVFYLINSYTFEPKDGVLSQLKSSGSLRYFKNKKLVSSLSEFDRLLETTGEVYTGYNNYILQNLQPFMINNLNTLQFDIFSRTVLVSDPDIYNWDKREAVLLANKINLKKTYDVFFVNRFLKQCTEKNLALITAIKKEYHL